MEKIPSKDGTPIAIQRSGAGAPLVLIHGTGGARSRWAPVLPALDEHFSVFAVDRRGRGGSGDREPYALEREVEDVAAVVESIGEPVHLLGHSFGGICALEAALLTRNLRKLVLYEPPVPVEGVPIYPGGVIERLEALMERGDRAGVLTNFMREIVRMPSHEFAQFKSSSAWLDRVNAAHTLPRELRAHERYRFKAERFKQLTVPTLLLLGSESPEFIKTAVAAVNAALPISQVEILPGQGHVAMDTAPDLFAREVTAFLSEVN